MRCCIADTWSAAPVGVKPRAGAGQEGSGILPVRAQGRGGPLRQRLRRPLLLLHQGSSQSQREAVVEVQRIGGLWLNQYGSLVEPRDQSNAGVYRGGRTVPRSLIRCVHARQERRPGGGGAWQCFDDNAVDSWDVANLERDCFGGRFQADMWDPKAGKHVQQVTFETGRPSWGMSPERSTPKGRMGSRPCILDPRCNAAIAGQCAGSLSR